MSKTHLGRLELSLLNNTSETIYRALSGSQIGDITVDWLNNIIYWIEFTSTKTKVSRMMLYIIYKEDACMCIFVLEDACTLCYIYNITV